MAALTVALLLILDLRPVGLLWDKLLMTGLLRRPATDQFTQLKRFGGTLLSRLHKSVPDGFEG